MSAQLTSLANSAQADLFLEFTPGQYRWIGLRANANSWNWLKSGVETSLKLPETVVNCGALYLNKTIHAVSCDRENSFVCEKPNPKIEL